MKGAIIFANHKHMRYAGETESGECFAFELLDSIELSVGDQIIGDFDALGAEDFKTLQGKTFSVFMEIAGGSRVSTLAWATK